MNKIHCLLFAFGLSLVCAIKCIDKAVYVNEKSKTCLITGVSSGIGKHLAIEMVGRGWKVIGVARRADRLVQLQQELGSEFFMPFVCDVTDLEQIHNVSVSIRTQGLQPTLFFLNAGIGERDEKWQPAIASHQQAFGTNYFGAIAWIDEWLLPVRQFGGGNFVAVSSLMARLALPEVAAYGASKAALVYCFESLRRQYLYDNIGFSVVLPGPVDTEMLKDEAAKKLPFIHHPAQEAQYIIQQVFVGKKIIEPAWFYAVIFRLLNFLPDSMLVKVFNYYD